MSHRVDRASCVRAIGQSIPGSLASVGKVWSNECGDFRSFDFGGVSARPRCAAIRGRAVVVEKSEAIGPEADLKLSVLELTNRSGARGTHGKVGSQHCSVGSQWERNSQLQMTYQSSQPPFRAALMLPRGYIL